MINEISIQNFQSHKQTNISFVNGLNVITGSSDSGKSSVLRALLWVVNNRPSGDSIKNWNSSPKDIVHVQLLVDNFFINKTRVNGKSSYNYKNEEGDSLCYDAIKTDVPEEISEQLNLSEFNIQTQHQPYFLLNDSGGEIAKKLNDLVGLSVIDNLFKNLNSSITRTDRELQRVELSIKEAEESINSLSYLDEVAEDVDSLTLIVKEYEELMESVFVINSSLEAYDFVEKEVKTYKKFLDVEDSIEILLDMIEKQYNELKENTLSIESSIERYSSVEEEFKEYKKFIENEESISILLKMTDEFVDMKGIEIDLAGTLDDADELKTDIKIYNRQGMQWGREYKNMIKNNPICPIMKTACKELENYGT